MTTQRIATFQVGGSSSNQVYNEKEDKLKQIIQKQQSIIKSQNDMISQLIQSQKQSDIEHKKQIEDYQDMIEQQQIKHCLYVKFSEKLRQNLQQELHDKQKTDIKRNLGLKQALQNFTNQSIDKKIYRTKQQIVKRNNQSYKHI